MYMKSYMCMLSSGTYLNNNIKRSKNKILIWYETHVEEQHVKYINTYQYNRSGYV